MTFAIIFGTLKTVARVYSEPGLDAINKGPELRTKSMPHGV